MHHADQPSGLVLDDADAKMLVPHGVYADGGSSQVREDGGPGCVAEEGGGVADAKLVGQQAEVVDVGFVGGRVTDGADKDKAGLDVVGVVFFKVVEEAREGAQDERMVLFGTELRDVEDYGFTGGFRVCVNGDARL